MDVPEIRHQVGYYLLQRTLASCIRVSKDWNRSFAEFLYHEFTVAYDFEHDFAKHPERFPSAGTLEKYAQHIQDLTLRETNWCINIFMVACHNIKRLELAYDNNDQDRVLRLIRNNPRLEQISIQLPVSYGRVSDTLNGFLGELPEACPQLKRLHIQLMTLTDEDLDDLMEICACGLQDLNLSLCKFTSNEPEKLENYVWPEALPHLVRLRLALVEGNLLSREKQFEWYNKCTHLESISWKRLPINSNHEPFPVRAFEQFLETRHIRSLEMAQGDLEDEDAARILDRCAPLTTFELNENPHLGAQTVAALARHFETLEDLSVYFENPLLTQMVLERCPRLLSLSSNLDAKYFCPDIASASKERLDRLHNQRHQTTPSTTGETIAPLSLLQPWACRGLAQIQVTIDYTDNPKLNQNVLSQLYQIKGLVTIIMTGRNNSSGHYFRFSHIHPENRIAAGLLPLTAQEREEYMAAIVQKVAEGEETGVAFDVTTATHGSQSLRALTVSDEASKRYEDSSVAKKIWPHMASIDWGW
ncbi:hypothetical protein BGZ83_009579 [Gryganskiella cystojenkinii]|nr:hypothetical protein BGZ83_009579 [Gryganskiella cystojenkinii]